MNYLSLSPSLFLFFFLLHTVTSICVPRSRDHVTLQRPDKPASVPLGNFSLKLPNDNRKTLVDLCSKTEYKDVCVSSVESVLPSSRSLDAAAILLLQLDVIKAKIQTVQAKVNELINDPKTDANTKKMLDVCKENYETGMYNIEDSHKALKAQDGATLNVNLSALADSPSTCEDAFDEANAKSPMKTEDSELEQLGVVAVTMSTLALPSANP